MGRILYPMFMTRESKGDNLEAIVTFIFPALHFPTHDEIMRAMEEVKNTLPDGFGWMDQYQSQMRFLRDEKGYKGPDISLPDKTGPLVL